MAIDAIDLFFIVMAAFGFYFGYTFGLMKVLLWCASFAISILVSMAFTPMITNLIDNTFNLDSLLLPFVAFFITACVILLFVRIFTKIIEEAVEKKRGNFISQLVGALGMSLCFTILYCVLITFFGQAGVINLVFNQDIKVAKSEKFVRLGVSDLTIGTPEPILVKIHDVDKPYKFLGDLRFGSNKYRTYFGGVDSEFEISPTDLISFNSKARVSIYKGTDKEVICFCDSTFLVSAQKDSIFFNCLDQFQSSQRGTSLLYQYIQVVPTRCSQLIQGLAPFVNNFIEYMSVAIDRLNNRNKLEVKKTESDK